VDVGGEEVICKTTLDVFWNSIGDELGVYLKIMNAATGSSLRVPKLKGK
jgi:hypothetical protein